jgi:hypothetical protein
MEKTIRFALELPLNRAQFNLFMPLPGSVEFEKLNNDGRLKINNWDRFFVHDVAYADSAEIMSKLKYLQRIAILRFYLRPRIVADIIKEIRSVRHLFFLSKRLIDALR